MQVGVGYRNELAQWIHSYPDMLECIEVTAEHFFDTDPDVLRELTARYTVYIHGLGLSLGTPGELDQEYLRKFADVCEIGDPEWVSEHIAFTRTEKVDLGHLNPVAYTESMLKTIGDHVDEVTAVCERRVLMENITSHLTLPGSMPETEFINRLCEKTGCGLLLDVTNLYVNSQNHGYQPLEWINEIKPEYIVQLHIVGYSKCEGRYEDMHSENIQPELWSLVNKVVSSAPVQAIIIERDKNFPVTEDIENEISLLKLAG